MYIISQDLLSYLKWVGRLVDRSGRIKLLDHGSVIVDESFERYGRNTKDSLGLSVRYFMIHLIHHEQCR